MEPQTKAPQDDALEQAHYVQSRYENYLLSKPHVVGVGVGWACCGGEQTSEIAVIVMVDRKLPPEQLEPMERIPSRLEGVRVDVQEMGALNAFSTGTVQ